MVLSRKPDKKVSRILRFLDNKLCIVREIFIYTLLEFLPGDKSWHNNITHLSDKHARYTHRRCIIKLGLEIPICIFIPHLVPSRDYISQSTLLLYWVRFLCYNNRNHSNSLSNFWWWWTLVKAVFVSSDSRNVLSAKYDLYFSLCETVFAKRNFWIVVKCEFLTVIRSYV